MRRGKKGKGSRENGERKEERNEKSGYGVKERAGTVGQGGRDRKEMGRVSRGEGEMAKGREMRG